MATRRRLRGLCAVSLGKRLQMIAVLSLSLSVLSLFLLAILELQGQNSQMARKMLL